MIVTAGGEAAREAKRATTTVPIVMAVSADPVEAGLVASFARPGGNMTGLTIGAGPEMEAKRLQLLREAVPTVARVAYLGLTRAWEGRWGESVRAAARELGVTVVNAEQQTPQDYAPAFSVIMREKCDGVLLSVDGHHFGQLRRLVEFAGQNRLPVIGYSREFAEAGTLIAYGADVVALFPRAAGYVDRILRGANPGDLPIERPTKFELVINLTAARRLGLAIPEALLRRADEIVQ